MKSSIARTASPASAQLARGAAGRDELDAEAGEATGEVGDPALVGDRQQRAAHADIPRLRHPPAPYRSHHHAARVVRVRRDGAAGDQPHDLGQQLVLERLQGRAHGGGVRRVGQLDGALGDDRARVDALVDEVDGHAEDLHAVGERLLDRADARERGQQRRVHVDHPAREAREEGGVDELHVAREHDELDPRAVEPRRHREVARPAVGVLRGRERAHRHAGRRGAVQRAGTRLVRAHGHDLDAVAAVHVVEDRLQVRALARREDADVHAASSTG